MDGNVRLLDDGGGLASSSHVTINLVVVRQLIGGSLQCRNDGNFGTSGRNGELLDGGWWLGRSAVVIMM